MNAYTHKVYYKIDYLEVGNDVYVCGLHSGLLVIGLAPTHRLRQGKVRQMKVTYPEKKAMKSVKKRGKQCVIQPESVIGEITYQQWNVEMGRYEDGKQSLYGLVPGKILEVNQGLLTHPELLIEDPYEKGFVAIVFVRKDKMADILQSFLWRDSYESKRNIGIQSDASMFTHALYWNCMAEKYDESFYGVCTHLAAEVVVERMVKEDQIGKEHKLLDVGHGDGAIILRWIERGLHQISGVDLSDGMVGKLAQICSERGVTGITLQQMAAESLSFPDASFHALTCNFVMMFVEDDNQTIQGFYRVLQPGGRVYITVWDVESDAFYGKVIKDAMYQGGYQSTINRMKEDELASTNTYANVRETEQVKYVDGRSHLEVDVTRFGSQAALKEALERNGFVDVKISSIDVGFDKGSIPETVAYWLSITRALYSSRVHGDLLHTIEKEFTARATETLVRAQTSHVCVPFLYATGRKP